MSTPEPSAFAVSVDRARVRTARRWNRGLVTGAIVVLVAAVAGIAAMSVTGFGSWLTIGVACLLALLCVVVVLTARSRTRMLTLLTGGDGVLRVDADGIRVPGLPVVAWADLVFVCVTNDRARTERMKRVPVYGWTGRAAIKAGNGTILCDLGVHDGEALRAAAGPAARAVSLYPRWPDGRRRATVPLLLDAVLDEAATQAVVRVLFDQAKGRGIPHALFEQIAPAIAWKGGYLDDVIAGARPR